MLRRMNLLCRFKDKILPLLSFKVQLPKQRSDSIPDVVHCISKLRL